MVVTVWNSLMEEWWGSGEIFEEFVLEMGREMLNHEMDEEDLEAGSSTGVHQPQTRPFPTRYPGLVRLKAYRFDGFGDYCDKEWDLAEGSGKKVNSPGPASSKFTFRLAARITEHSVITVSLGRVPRLGFSPMGQSLLTEIPSVESPSPKFGRDETIERGGIVIKEHVLDFLLTMNHSEEADNPVPKSVSNLVVHVIDTHLDHLEDVVTKLEIELDSVEVDLDKGGFALKKQLLDDRRFPKMHLDLQRLLQSIAHGEQVFPRVKEKCSTKDWFSSEDINSLEELIGRLRRLKDNVGFISNRVTAVQAGLDSWQAEQINRKLYCLSFLSIIFLPLSIITGVFGMNVGGVPWTQQRDPKLKNGFRNVLLVCVATLVLVLLCFLFPFLYSRLTAWRRQRALKRSWSINHRSFLKRTIGGGERGGYLRL
ncbi:Mg2+ transporter protein, CorA-like/Zinc transport protein ZntB [Cynara cardunculus var. scolymus]|uniref:Mg2+ transporter protein, CorA-like/Zinc transport protein ZntB n=1 Tax=Cynara cardunculus var. scolymus TaxID=59895 RepID=A0A118K6L6_CYNCS|nr:Mg2+ transporter protein, CorA-like/Zinc transport protein ZntB [Cynara cardunculus var. scolymus]